MPVVNGVDLLILRLKYVVNLLLKCLNLCMFKYSKDREDEIICWSDN